VRWMVLPAVLAALALAVAGCGGSDSGSDAGGSDDVMTIETTDDSTVTDVMTDEDTTETDVMTDEDSGTDTSPVDLSGSGLSKDCQDLIQASAKYAEAFGSIGAGGDFDLQDSAAALSAVADAAPSEIRDAFQTLAKAVGAYAEALQGVDLSSGEAPSPETLAKITAATSSFDNAEVTAASEAISKWTEDNCGATP